MKLMKYLNKRGGRIVLSDIRKPERHEWGTAEDAMTAALELEKEVNEVCVHFRLALSRGIDERWFLCFQSLLSIHAQASEHNDANFCDFLESEYLNEQVDAIKEIADHVTNLKRVGDGLGVFVFDQKLQQQQNDK